MIVCYSPNYSSALVDNLDFSFTSCVYSNVGDAVEGLSRINSSDLLGAVVIGSELTEDVKFFLNSANLMRTKTVSVALENTKEAAHYLKGLEDIGSKFLTSFEVLTDIVIKRDVIGCILESGREAYPSLAKKSVKIENVKIPQVRLTPVFSKDLQGLLSPLLNHATKEETLFRDEGLRMINAESTIRLAREYLIHYRFDPYVSIPNVNFSSQVLLLIDYMKEVIDDEYRKGAFTSEESGPLGLRLLSL